MPFSTGRTGFDEHGYCFVCDKRHSKPACEDNYANNFRRYTDLHIYDNRPYYASAWPITVTLGWTSIADGAD